MQLELHERLNAYLIDKCFNRSAIARAIDVDPRKFASSLNGRRELRAQELLDTCHVLGISCDDLMAYEPSQKAMESLQKKAS